MFRFFKIPEIASRADTPARTCNFECWSKGKWRRIKPPTLILLLLQLHNKESKIWTEPVIIDGY